MPPEPPEPDPAPPEPDPPEPPPELAPPDPEELPVVSVELPELLLPVVSVLEELPEVSVPVVLVEVVAPLGPVVPVPDATVAGLELDADPLGGVSSGAGSVLSLVPALPLAPQPAAKSATTALASIAAPSLDVRRTLSLRAGPCGARSADTR